MDDETRSLEREALKGDPFAQFRLLVAKQRASATISPTMRECLAQLKVMGFEVIVSEALRGTSNMYLAQNKVIVPPEYLA